jgi:hypothetical protein
MVLSYDASKFCALTLDALDSTCPYMIIFYFLVTNWVRLESLLGVEKIHAADIHVRYKVLKAVKTNINLISVT